MNRHVSRNVLLNWLQEHVARVLIIEVFRLQTCSLRQNYNAETTMLSRKSALSLRMALARTSTDQKQLDLPSSIRTENFAVSKILTIGWCKVEMNSNDSTIRVQARKCYQHTKEANWFRNAKLWVARKSCLLADSFTMLSDKFRTCF